MLDLEIDHFAHNFVQLYVSELLWIDLFMHFSWQSQNISCYLMQHFKICEDYFFESI